jgi:hypothetical protein
MLPRSCETRDSDMSKRRPTSTQRIVKLARDSLANLQLLPGGENIGKSERLPLEWAREKYPNPQGLRGYLEQNDVVDLPENLEGFLDFYEQRRTRMRERLVAVLGREPGSLTEADPVAADVELGS